MGLRTIRVVGLICFFPIVVNTADGLHATDPDLVNLLRTMGAGNSSGGTLLSYLLFEGAYTRELIALGYADALARREELRRFLQLDTRASAGAIEAARAPRGAARDRARPPAAPRSESALDLR
jgi:NTE family protein